MMRNLRRLLSLIIIPGLSYAAQPEVSVDCSVPEGYTSDNFEDLKKEAVEVNQEICLAFLGTRSPATEETQKNLYHEFGSLVQKTANVSFGDFSFRDMDKPFTQFTDTISQGKLNQKKLPAFAVELDGPDYSFSFEDTVNAGTFPRSGNGECEESYQTPCNQLLKDFGRAVNAYKHSYKTLTARDTRVKLGKMSADWDQFLSDGRSQTMLGLIFTTYMERDHFKVDHLVGPPKRQWVLLHPNLVYEYVDAAPDGDQDQAGVAIEWVGVNWWGNDSPLFGVPFGVSLASIYSDRPEVDDTGHGLMFHFDNKYSLGWSYRDGDNGVYLSLDLLKLFENKDQQFRRYKERMLE